MSVPMSIKLLPFSVTLISSFIYHIKIREKSISVYNETIFKFKVKNKTFLHSAEANSLQDRQIDSKNDERADKQTYELIVWWKKKRKRLLEKQHILTT